MKQNSMNIGLQLGRTWYLQLLVLAVLLLVFTGKSEAARIYNFTGGEVKVCTTGIVSSKHCHAIPDAGNDSSNYKRSKSLSWKNTTGLNVMKQGKLLCRMDFGLHAQIQGGNYMVIKKDKCTVYDSKKKIIAKQTNKGGGAYPLAQVVNHSMHRASGVVAYASAFCSDDHYTVGPAKMVKDKLVPTTWMAENRGACLVDKITAKMADGKKAATYTSLGTSYGTFELRPTKAGYRMYSKDEYKKIKNASIGTGPGFYIRNDTEWPLAISLSQAGCLYYDVIDPGQVFKRNTGAVWFTINANIQPDGKLPNSDWDCVKPVAKIVGAVALAAASGGYGAFAASAAEGAAVATSATIATAGLTAAGVALAKQTVDTVGKIITDNGTLKLTGQYAGYEWPFRCDQMPQYKITGGPKIIGSVGGLLALTKGPTFTLTKTNTCGNSMMKSGNTKATAPNRIDMDKIQDKNGAISALFNKFEKSHDHAIAGHNDKTLSKTSVSECLSVCAETTWCQSVEYNNDSNGCNLSKQSGPTIVKGNYDIFVKK